MTSKIINLNKTNNHTIDSMKNLLQSSSKINALIKNKKKTLKNPIDYLHNFEFKKTKRPNVEIKNDKPIQHLQSTPPKQTRQSTPPKQTRQSTPPKQTRQSTPPKQTRQNISPKSNAIKHKAKFKKSPVIQSRKTKSIDKFFKKKKTKKYNKYEIKYIIYNLKKLIDKNDYKNINKLLKKLNRYQIIQLLSEYKIIKSSSTAPLPLLKNLIFNFILGNIYIIK